MRFLLPKNRCALTTPFHPCLDKAVYFLWHFPWGRPRRALPGTVFPWSPDFPPRAALTHNEERPSDRLARALRDAVRQICQVHC